MPSSRLLLPVAAVLDRLAVRPTPAPVRLDLAAATGGVLAEDLVAGAAVPSRAVALVDGVAVAAHDLVGASPYSPAVLAAPPPPVRAGEALPAGCDAVLPAEAVSLVGGFAEIGLTASPGENARRAGEDIAPGGIVRRAGEIVRPFDAALARLAGLADAPVRRATLAIACAEEDRTWIAAIFAPVVHGAILRFEAAAETDLTIALGRIDDHDPAWSAIALSEAEGWRLREEGGSPVLEGPARPAAAFALARAVVAPFLDRLLGRAPVPAWRRGPLLRKIPSRIGWTEIALLRESGDGLEPLAVGTLPLWALARAEGYCVVPPESEGLPDGSIVAALAV